MATENYNVKVQVQGARQIDKLNASTIRVQNSLGGLGSAAKLAGGAIAAIGAARIGRAFLNTARQIETLQQRFKFLFGTAEEGAKAFDQLADFAGTVPFSLEEIAAASGVLAVVSKDAEELRTNLELTGNVAAVTGLDFRTAGEQIQRSLSGGIGAADLLREKGVRNLLGFKDGVKVTAEETAEALERVFGPDGKFGEAALALASTFDGLVSMVGDKMFNFQRLVMDAGPFDFLKAIVGTLNDTLSEQFGDIEKAAERIGAGIVHSAETAIVGSGYILDAMMPVFKVFQESYNNILAATNQLPATIKTLGVIGFLLLGIKGKAIVLAIGYVMDYAVAAYATIGDALAKAKEMAATAAEAIGMTGTAQRLRGEAADIRAEMNGLREQFDTTGVAADEAGEMNMTFIDRIESGEVVLGAYGQKLYELVLQLREKQEALKKTAEQAKELEDAINGTGEATKRSEVTFKNLKDTFIDTFDKMYEKFDPVQEGVNLLTQGFETFKKGVGDAFADAILGAKNLTEALGQVAKAIFKQLISGIIQIGLEIFVFDILREKLKGIRNEQSKLNQQLGVELGLRAALAFFTGGSSIGIPFLAEGGPAKRNHPYIVGEQGPELFVPNNSGTVVPNDQLAMDTSSGSGDVNVTFNINTVDASGFDELLLSRRAVITGIINEGVARKGRKALI